MAATTKIKAEERFAGLQRRDQAIKEDIENATRLRLEKTARLRTLRLAKEAEEAATKKKLAAEMKVPTKAKAPAAKAPAKVNAPARAPAPAKKGPTKAAPAPRTPKSRAKKA
jgi:hypothetical protein